MKDQRIQQAARRALGLEAGEPEPPRKRTDRFVIPEPERDAQIERMSLDVRLDERVEAVLIVLRDGELTWSCTDGTAGRESAGPPSSPHVRSALRWIGGAGGAAGLGSWPGAPLAGTSSTGTIGAETAGEPRRAATESDDVAPRRLAAALDDAITALARAGIVGRESPSVRDAIERAARCIAPTPLPVARWIGRLERAMRAGDTRTLARLLDGAALGADDLRAGTVGARGRAWLGRGGAVEQLVDRPMIEVARESLDGTERAAIERRYLIDLTSGELLCEERARTEGAPSLGPCPRALTVGLAEAIAGPAPRRVRLLQYTVALEVPEVDLERVVATALRRTSMALERHREAITEWPALGEPVAVIAVAGIEDGFLVDAVGEPIPIARDEDPGAAAALEAATRAGDVEWVVGRMVATHAAVRMVPCAFARRGTLVRLR